MAMPPTIQTDRLTILPFNEQHLTGQYVRWLNDPETNRYSEQRHSQHTLASCAAYAASFNGTPHYFWAIEADTLGHIGNMNAYRDLANGVADVGILIGEAKARGAGYGKEAWCAAVERLLGESGIRKVTAGTVATNLPMLRLMEAAGMADDGRRHRHHVIDGQEVDLIHGARFGSP